MHLTPYISLIGTYSPLNLEYPKLLKENIFSFVPGARHRQNFQAFSTPLSSARSIPTHIRFFPIPIRSDFFRFIRNSPFFIVLYRHLGIFTPLSTPSKTFHQKYPYPPETRSISIPVRVTHSMKGSNRTSIPNIFTSQYS